MLLKALAAKAFPSSAHRQGDSMKTVSGLTGTGQIELDSSYTAVPEASRSDLTITALRPTPGPAFEQPLALPVGPVRRLRARCSSRLLSVSRHHEPPWS